MGQMMSTLTRGERLQIILQPEEWEAIENFRFTQKMPTRAAAVRELFRLGLAARDNTVAVPKQRSRDFGVLRSPSVDACKNGGHSLQLLQERSEKGGIFRIVSRSGE